MAALDPTAAANDLADLTRAPASDVKKKGWRRLMKTLETEGAGRLLVTHHDEPQAVILAADEYLRLMNRLHQDEEPMDEALAALRQQFDARLAALEAADAADRLRGVSRSDATLDGEVKAGTTY